MPHVYIRKLAQRKSVLHSWHCAGVAQSALSRVQIQPVLFFAQQTLTSKFCGSIEVTGLSQIGDRTVTFQSSKGF